jgi:hypothetical protein
MLIYNRRSVGQSILVSGSHLESVTRFLFLSDYCRFLDVGAPSMTRGWVYNLLVQLLLGLTSAITLGSKSRRTHNHILFSFETPPNCRARSMYLYPPGTEWPSYNPGHWVPFHRLLLLAGLWWKYSNPPPHGYLQYC